MVTLKRWFRVEKTPFQTHVVCSTQMNRDSHFALKAIMYSRRRHLVMYIYQVINCTKTRIAFMNSFGDDFSAIHHISSTAPRVFGHSGFMKAMYGRSNNEWMTSNFLLQFLWDFTDCVSEKKIKLPVIFFVNEHSTNMSLLRREPHPPWGPGGLSRECVLRIPSVIVKGN